MIRIATLTFVVLWITTVVTIRPLAADVIELENGDTIHADVIQITTKTLKIRHPIFGEAEIPRDMIRGIVLGKPAADPVAKGDVPKGDAPNRDVPNIEASEGEQETPKQIIDRLVNKEFGPKAVEKLEQGAVRQSTPQDAVEQLRVEGIDPKIRSSLHLMLPGFGAPEVQNYFNGRVDGLMNGSINIQDIRKDAIGARDQLKEIMDDLGTDGAALQGYYSILDNFIQKTTPPNKEVKDNEARNNDARKKTESKQATPSPVERNQR